MKKSGPILLLLLIISLIMSFTLIAYSQNTAVHPAYQDPAWEGFGKAIVIGIVLIGQFFFSFLCFLAGLSIYLGQRKVQKIQISVIWAFSLHGAVWVLIALALLVSFLLQS